MTWVQRGVSYKTLTAEGKGYELKKKQMLTKFWHAKKNLGKKNVGRKKDRGDFYFVSKNGAASASALFTVKNMCLGFYFLLLR